MTTRPLDVDSIWKASDGRLLRVVSISRNKIGVRNVQTSRLSYMQRCYFENEKAGIGWWLEPFSTPLLDAVDPHAQSEGKLDHARMTLSELLTAWKAEDARLDRQIEIDIGGFDRVSQRTHVEQLRLLRERTTALEMALKPLARLTALIDELRRRGKEYPSPDFRLAADEIEAVVQSLALPPAPPQEQELDRLRAERDGARVVAWQMQDRLADCQQQLAASPPAQEQEIELVRKVLNADLKIASERVLTLELENQRLRKALAALEGSAGGTHESATMSDSKAPALPPAHGWQCKARRTTDPPQDCDWPFCGCDPYADKVIAAIEESGRFTVHGWQPQEQDKETKKI